MQRTSIRRVLGRAAAGAIVVSVAAVPLGQRAAEAETPAVQPPAAQTAGAETAAAGTAWSVSTDAPDGLQPSGDGGFAVAVPYDVCAIDWTLIGGQGGAGSTTAGKAGGEVRMTIHGTAAGRFYLHPGTAGQDGATGAAGGTDAGGRAPGAPGTSDGAGAGGGGGAGSSLTSNEGFLLVAHGGDGGGDTGGAGGSYLPGPSGNTVISPSGPAPLVPAFDGRTSDPGGSARTGAGVISGVGVPCPATPPGAPRILKAGSAEEPGAIRLVVQPTAPRSYQIWSPVTGWEVTLDGGATWRPLLAAPLPGGTSGGQPVDGLLEATVRGLADGDHQLAVRVTSAVGPSAPSAVRTVRLAGTPTEDTGTYAPVTDVSVVAGISSLRVSWTPPEGEVRGGYVAESYDAAQDGENIPFSLCETALDVHSCVLAAEPGRSYRVVVLGGGGRAAAPVTSGVVSSPPVPTQLPASSGALQVPAGALAPGDRVDVSGTGYLAGSTVTVVVYSTPTVLASLATTADGSFDTGVTLPAGLPAGEHTLVATGVGPDGETRTLTQPITVRGTGGGEAAAPVSGGLAYTGADLTVPAVGGIAALAAGASLLLIGRRRRTAERG